MQTAYVVLNSGELLSVRIQPTDPHRGDVWEALGATEAYEVDMLDAEGNSMWWEDVDVPDSEASLAEALFVLTQDRDAVELLLDAVEELEPNGILKVERT